MSENLSFRIKEGRSAILDAAARLFSRDGYASTSMRDIAEAAGMKAGSLYYHFSSKDEIVAEMIELGVRAVADEVTQEAERTRSEGPTAQLAGAIRGHLRTVLRQHAYASANIRIYSELPDRLRRRTHAARKRYDDIWRRIIADCEVAGALRKDIDANVLRLLLIGAMNGTLEWYRPTGRLSIDALASSFASIVLNGVGEA